MTTTFHFETNEPQYEYSFEGADLQLRCQALVAVATGPTAGFGEDTLCSWFELSPFSGNRILAGVGRCVPHAGASSALETREAVWAKAMAGLVPGEFTESIAAVADSVYALVDPTNGHVDLGRAGRGTTALVFDGSETRLAQSASAEAEVVQSASFELPAGSTLLLLTHDPAEREALMSAVHGILAARSVRGEEESALVEHCLELRHGPLSQCESIVALHFERFDGSPVIRNPADPPPFEGAVVNEDALVTDGKSKGGLYRTDHHRKRSRCRVVGTVPVPRRRDVDGFVQNVGVARHNRDVCLKTRECWRESPVWVRRNAGPLVRRAHSTTVGRVRNRRVPLSTGTDRPGPCSPARTSRFSTSSIP